MHTHVGCQDTLYFLRHSEVANEVSAVILQGGVSDRDGDSVMLSNASEMLQEARALVQNGQQEAFLKYRYYDTPVTAARFLSFTERLGDDDMFSLDLTEDELGPIFSPVKVPIALCYSRQDQYVVDKEGQKAFADKLVKLLKKTAPVVECEYFIGNHGLEERQDYEKFVEYVCKFISSFK